MPHLNWHRGARDLEKLLKAAEKSKPLFEIAAILAAGFWAWRVFGLTEAPGLKENFKIESSLIWHPLRTDRSCLAEWKVSVTNGSKSTVKIRKVLKRAWLVDRPEPGSPFNGIKPYDAMKAADALGQDGSNPQWYQTDEPFVQTYPPAGGAEYAFEWFVENRPNTYMVVRLDFYGDDAAQNLLDFRYDWGPPCEFEDSKSGKVATNVRPLAPERNDD